MSEKLTHSDVYSFALMAFEQNPAFIEDMQRAFVVGVRERETKLRERMSNLDMAAMMALTAVNGKRLSPAFREAMEIQLAEYWNKQVKSPAIAEFLQNAREKNDE